MESLFRSVFNEYVSSWRNADCIGDLKEITFACILYSQFFLHRHDPASVLAQRPGCIFNNVLGRCHRRKERSSKKEKGMFSHDSIPSSHESISSVAKRLQSFEPESLTRGRASSLPSYSRSFSSVVGLRSPGAASMVRNGETTRIELGNKIVYIIPDILGGKSPNILDISMLAICAPGMDFALYGV